MIETPVVLVVFRRPDLTRQVLSAIRDAGVRRLFILADGPRKGNSKDLKLVSETRELVSQIDWDCEVTRIYSDSNLGLRMRVMTGLDIVFSMVDRAIILEDDCLPHRDFFRFASELLDFYENDSRVGLISANNFAPTPKAPESYYFSSYANIWGWATWRRTWADFRKRKTPLPLDSKTKSIISSRLHGIFRARAFLALTEKAPELDSWAIEFVSFFVVQERLSAVPKVNLCRNIGFGSDSTHTKFESYADEVETQPIGFPLKHPRQPTLNIKKMKRESWLKSRRWLVFPFLHPLDFAGRASRAAPLLISKFMKK